MRSPRRIRVLASVSLLLAGCASYRPPPLTTRHPAHPDAPAAVEWPPSTTLAHAPSDVASVRSVPAGAVPHQGHASRATEGEASQTVVGEGEVVSTVPKASQIVVDHLEIKGFMEAMTMGYRIDPPSLLEGLKPGDKIRFTIDVRRRVITAIEKVH